MNALPATIISLLRIVSFGASLVFATNAISETLVTKSGTTFEGDLYKILDQELTLKIGEKWVAVPLSEFEGESRDAIRAWAEANPQMVDVYTKWDVQPQIKSSSMPRLPEQFMEASFQGMVSVELVLDEKGSVIHASIRKSTHAALETPSLEAAKSWIFEPAQIEGKRVKAKLRVPFKFVYTPPPPEADSSS